MPTLNVVVVIDTSGSCNSATASSKESLESAESKTKKKLFLSKKLQNLKINFEAKLHKNLKPFPLITNENYIKSETTTAADFTISEIFLDIEQYDNNTSILRPKGETSDNNDSDSDDQFPLIDKDSIDESFETQMSTNQNNLTKMQLPAPTQTSAIPTLRPNPHVISNNKFGFGFKPTSVSVPLSSIPSAKASQHLSQTNNNEKQNQTHKAVPLSNSPLKKFEALNIQLSESESSSLSSVSSSSSASSSSSSSSSFAVTSQSNSKNKSTTSSSLSTATSTDLETDSEKKQDLSPPPLQQAPSSTNSQLISFLKHPMSAFNSLNSNLKTTNSNIKSQPSIPTILRQKSQIQQQHQSSMHSLSYASLSSSSSTSVKIVNNENEKIISNSLINKQLPPQSRFIQPKRQNQLLNPNRIKKNSPVRKPPTLTTTSPSDNLSNETAKTNKLTTELLPKNDTNIKIIKHRRIFCPYSHNSNSNNSDNVSISSSSTSDSISSNRDETDTVSESNVSNTALPPQKSSLIQPASYKLLSHLGSFKNSYSNDNSKNSNELKTKYFSKLPHKVNHQPGQNKDLIQPTENYTTKPLDSNHHSSETLKKEDSAYCSSTSSTASSHESTVETTATTLNQNDNRLSAESKYTKTNEFNYHSIENIQNTVDAMDAAAKTVTSLLENEEIGETNNNVVTFTAALDPSPATTTPTDTKNYNKIQIQDSLGELNHLMMTSSSTSSIPVTIHATTTTPNKNESSSIQKQRKLSTTSFSSLNPITSPAPMFKPPSQLPPVENGEVIQLDIETYRFLMQDLQSTKAILCKVANMLREPSIDLNVFETTGSAEQEYQNMKMTNPIVASLYNFQIGGPTESQNIERFDQSTQTDT